MGRFLKADLKIKNVYDIDTKMLKNKGIKGILFDIDNTLVSYETPEPDEKLVAFLKGFAEKVLLLTFL